MLRASKKIALFSIVILFLFTATLWILSNFTKEGSAPPGKEIRETKQEQNVSRLTTIASNLEIPWGLVFLSGGDILFTERPGKVKLISKDDIGGPTLIADIAKVKHLGEGGLLGIALHPDFENNKYVYLYYTYSSTGDNTLNRVVRYKFVESKLKDERVIVDAIPGAVNHNGGRIKFGPDKFLYITTGDAQNPSLAQDRTSLAGKILRVTDDGEAAPGNPFNNLVYSYGHRNPQGLTWDSNGRLWATEHGSSAHDELNLIDPPAGGGRNYGWPVIQGGEKEAGMETSLLNSGSDTWAPAGATFIGESLFFGGLRGQTLYEAIIKEDQITLKEHLKGKFGRIRDVVLGPDGSLYLTTSNRDGRGNPRADDDKIIRVNPNKL